MAHESRVLGSSSSAARNNEPVPEFIAFAYIRGTDSKRPMLGIGMVCNSDQEKDRDRSSLFLMVMVPKDADLVRTEYMLDFQENITVNTNVVLARDLSFENGTFFCPGCTYMLLAE